jgi:hypothetical protein
MVTLMPPHVVHDGRPAAAAGYRKRVLYVGTELLGEYLSAPPSTAPTSSTPLVVRGVRSLHRALGDPGDTSDAEWIFSPSSGRASRSISGIPAMLSSFLTIADSAGGSRRP